MSSDAVSQVTARGQITLPAELRREMGIGAGDKVRFVRKGSQVLLELCRPAELPAQELEECMLFGMCGESPQDVAAGKNMNRPARAVYRRLRDRFR